MWGLIKRFLWAAYHKLVETLYVVGSISILLCAMWLIAEYGFKKHEEKFYRDSFHEMNMLNAEAHNNMNIGLYWIKEIGQQIDHLLTEPGMKLKRLNR